MPRPGGGARNHRDERRSGGWCRSRSCAPALVDEVPHLVPVTPIQAVHESAGAVRAILVAVRFGGLALCEDESETLLDQVAQRHAALDRVALGLVEQRIGKIE